MVMVGKRCRLISADVYADYAALLERNPIARICSS